MIPLRRVARAMYGLQLLHVQALAFAHALQIGMTEEGGQIPQGATGFLYFLERPNYEGGLFHLDILY